MPEENPKPPSDVPSEPPGAQPGEASEREEDQTDNPTPDGGMAVTVSVPESIEIRMVNAATFEDYEVWFFLSSLAWGALVGFVVAALQAGDELRLPWTLAAVFVGLLFVVFVWQTFAKRRLLKRTSKTRAIPYIQAPKPRRRPNRARPPKKGKEVEHEPKGEQ